MKNTREDLRTQKTYAALIQAFQELIQEKSFEQITVVELCRKAHTRTATFYNHFSDKYDFFSFMIRRLRDEYMEHAEMQSDPSHPETYYMELIRRGFDFLEEHAAMVENIESDTLLTTIMQTVSDGIVKSLQTHITADRGEKPNFHVNPEISTQVFLGAILQCSRWWFENRRRISKEETVEQLSIIIKNCIVLIDA